MVSTIIVIALFLGLLAGSILVWVAFLHIGLLLGNVQDVTTRRMVVATILVLVLQVAYKIVSHLVSLNVPEPDLFLAIVYLGFAVLIPWFVIQHVFKTSSSRALLVCVSTLLTPVVMFAFAILIVRPFLVEAFVIPTNSMAPTLLGNHSVGTCLECGSPAYCSPVSRQHVPPGGWLMICRDNFHVSRSTDRGDQEFDGDCLLVAKFLKPRRWDLIVFRYPEDPSVLYVMRLVGLPGEEITIQDGQVLADGQVLTPPDSIKGIKYVTEIPGLHEISWGENKIVTEIPGLHEELWGSPDRPAKLADDEYFVLGDFSQASKDSRLWRLSASGHNPYAVPESHLLGVVTHIYWPPSRWRVLQ